jgi:hypothetical protein
LICAVSYLKVPPDNIPQPHDPKAPTS